MQKIRGLLQKNHILAPYTSWQVGGSADYFYQPKDIEDLAVFLQGWQDETLLLGAGSNVLIRDGGVRGGVLYLKGTLNNFEQVANSIVRVGAGLSLGNLVQATLDLGMTGQAFLAGIPATVGGALAMNAGAHGDSIWNHVVLVETINRQGEIAIRTPNEFEVSYRHVVGLRPYEWFVAAQLQFPFGDRQETQQKIQELMLKRRLAQPLDEPNCGSVFRNPLNDYAARLIEASHLKGHQIGAAQVSEKHANFIVNKGGAKASDIEALISLIMDKVYDKHQVELIPEVRILGEK